MATTSPAISKRLDVKRSYIRHKKRGGEVVVFSKDTSNKDGGDPHDKTTWCKVNAFFRFGSKYGRILYEKLSTREGLLYDVRLTVFG